MLFGIIYIAALLARAERTIGTICERHNNSLELLLSFLFLNTSVRKMGISEIFSTLKHNKSSPPCVQFSKCCACKAFFSPFLHLIYCWEAYTTGFNNDLNKLFSFPGTLRLLGSFTILCSLLLLQSCLSWAHIKGIEFLNCCLIFSKEEKKNPPYYSLHQKVTSRYISYTSQKEKKNGGVFHKGGKEGCAFVNSRMSILNW